MSPHPADLETILTCLEVSALMLTPVEGARFTKQQLFKGALGFVPEMEERDLDIVFAGMGRTFKKVGREFELR